jgi:spermidine synthase
MRNEQEVTRESGRLLYYSCLANAAGYLFFVLVGHPMLSIGSLLAMISAVTLAAAGLVSVRIWSNAQSLTALLGIVLTVMMIAQWEDRNFYFAQWRNQLEPEAQVVTFKSGAESASLLRTPSYEWVSYNGHPSIYVQRDGEINSAEIISGIIPALGAPRLDRALVLGFGTGITAGAVSRIFQSTDVVEINGAFLEMMPQLSHANLEIETNPNVNIHLTDGRAFLAGKHRAYDVIINSIPAPDYFAASKIYTVEFYQLAEKALKDDGVFCTWLAIPEMSDQGIMVILSALRKSFSYCDLRILRHSYYMATCSNRAISPSSFRELPAEEILARKIHQSLVGYDLDYYFEDTRISDNIFKAFVPRVDPENTDDYPVLEFHLLRQTNLPRRADIFLARAEELNIDPLGEARLLERERLFHRAKVLESIGPVYYRRYLLPLLLEQEETRVAWASWKERFVKLTGDKSP